MKHKALEISPGAPLTLGVRDCCDGFNFSVFSRHAERVELLLFASPSEVEPCRIVDLDPAVHRTGDVWHVLVNGIKWGQAYAFRVHGPWTPTNGHRFDSRVALLDPYARAVVGTDGWACRRLAPIDDSRRFDQPVSEFGARPPKSLLVDRRFEWEGVRRPKRPWSETVIYETHVRGFTIDASSKVAHPGTFLGLVEKIPYLLELGVTAVELMPVQEFDTRDNPRHNDITGEQLKNYWGYNTVCFSRLRSLTAPGAARAARSTTSRSWSASCIELASKPFSMSCSTTPPRAVMVVPPSTSVVWITRSITCWTARAVSRLYGLRQHAQL